MKALSDFFPFAISRTKKRKALNYIGRNWALLFLMLMLGLFSILGERFFGFRNFSNILLASTTLLLLASGETFVIISGGIDLSIGFIMGFVCVTSAIIMRDLHAAGFPQVISILAGSSIGILLGLIPGFINGVFITKFRVPPFIATLGMWGIANGMAWRFCQGFPIAFLPQIGRAHV